MTGVPESLYLSGIVALCMYIFTLFYKAYLKVHKQEPDPVVYAVVTFIGINACHYYLNEKKSPVMSETFM